MAFGAPPQAPDGAKPRTRTPGQAQLQQKMRQMQGAKAGAAAGLAGAKPPAPRMPMGAPGQGAQFGRGAGGPPGMPDPAMKAQLNAQMKARYPDGPPMPGRAPGGPGVAMRGVPTGGAKPPAPAMPMGRPGMPQAQFGAKPPAPQMSGGPFGMRPPQYGGGMFGPPTKAPMATGQASPFAGAGALPKGFGFG
jgi:hypothetical protein